MLVGIHGYDGCVENMSIQHFMLKIARKGRSLTPTRGRPASLEELADAITNCKERRVSDSDAG